MPMSEYSRGYDAALTSAIAEFEQIANEVERERHPIITNSAAVLETVRACAAHLKTMRRAPKAPEGRSPEAPRSQVTKPEPSAPWCPECKMSARIDEDGCCVVCGADTDYVHPGSGKLINASPVFPPGAPLEKP